MTAGTAGTLGTMGVAWRGLPGVQRWAWGYALLFGFVVAVSHAPGLTDADGNLLGLFHIDPIDDAVHAASGLWAALAAWRSRLSSRFYFLVFGTFYTGDALVGLFTGYSMLEFLPKLGVSPDYSPGDVLRNLPANLPHFVIGPGALLIGLRSRASGARSQRLVNA
ncbi:MAG TPA: DUF4383 domain-containing protein [Chloroflexota bacterium]|nr:DUF4383 domain-containing protein [Chloroflexota bacterium]